MIVRVAGGRLAAGLCLIACGCSVARELPRSEYAARPERNHVKVETQSGQKYEFERVRVAADSLYGDHRLDVEGPFDQFETVGMPLTDVIKVSVREVDWYRTGLIAGVAVAGVLAAVLSQQHTGSGGGVEPGPCGARPCP